MARKRKDIHRPAAIQPEEYEFVAFDYLPSSPGDLGAAMFLAEQRKRKTAHMARTGGKRSNHEHGGNCAICGSVNAIYTASFWHKPSNSYISTGLDCADKLECEGIEAFRKNVKAAKEAQAGKKKAKAILDEAGLSKAWELYEADIAKSKAFAAAHKEWLDAGGDHHDEEGAPKWIGRSREEDTALDIVSKVVKYGNAPSDKAQAYLKTLLDKIERAPEIAAEKAAAKALEMADAKPVPMVDGRVQIKGEVLTIKVQEGFYGSQIKMLVKAEAGFKLWGTVPSAIVDDVEKGATVEFSAALNRSDDDEYFGFFSRPSKAKVIKALAA